ncbi:hypothetical protein [Alkalihalobacillus pseudalcaliphilus]|uniref:hypothetical protein n=1 Tax=Alkalihalobacillus pseudalcaliphilus TaxID=79884 RepID=UPI00064DD3F2|nr:hypothetical protein [Alkalihalobacillus pseudalcaliphilus]KMK77712.1 hypothetical protein AB990_04450 [Alkalihalobacillus pseudalcaliphilus]
MTLSVYYDEMDGELQPQWMLLPADFSGTYATYSLNMPYQRFYMEDFHDDLAIITVTQASLTKDAFYPHGYAIHIEQLRQDLRQNGQSTSIEHADYFLVRFDDLEDVLQMSVRNQFSESDTT